MPDLITRYEQWMHHPRGRRRRYSDRTISERIMCLRRADRELREQYGSGLDRASDDELEAWLDRYTGWTAATYWGHLSGLYTCAVRFGWLGLDPMAELVPPEQGERTAKPVEDWELAIAIKAPDYWHRAVMLAAYAGLRCTEICTVTTHDIVGGWLRVLGKGRRVRTVPLHPALVEELHGTPPGHLLVGARGGPISGRTLTQHQRPVWAALGLDDEFTLHRLRHWCLTRLREEGAELRDAQELAGHADPRTTAGYTKVGDRRLRELVSRLPWVRPEPDDGRLGPTQVA